MKLLYIRFIIDTLQIGGTEKHLALILPGLIKKGWKIKVITMTSIAPLKPFLENQEIEVKIAPKWFDSNVFSNSFLRFVRIGLNIGRLAWDFMKDRHSITHFFLPRSYGLGMIASLLTVTKSPQLMSRRGLNYYQLKYPGFKNLEKFFHRRCAYVLGNSKAIIDQLHQDEKVPLERLKLLYNGIPTDIYKNVKPRDVVRESLGCSKDDIIIICVANLIPYKGHCDLLKALAYYKSTLPKKWKLLCVGRDENTQEKLIAFAKINNLSDHILWLGLRQDVPDLLKASDIGVLCSHEEGFSNAILEGMAAGLPMIVTDVGGNKEAVLHSVTGLIVSPKNPEELGRAIVTLANDLTVSKRLGNSGQKRVEEFFSLEKCVQTYHDLYLSLLG